MKRARVSRAAIVALFCVLLTATTFGVGAAGEKFAVFGADLTPAERQELATLFGLPAGDKSPTITNQELIQALQGTNLPVAPGEKAISSSGLTCKNKGEGLTVRTQNITRVPAAVYANALVTAGVGDADVLIAAPASNPVTGETALVGVLKAFPQCQGTQQPDPKRVALAYEQVGATAAMAGPGGDLNKASSALLTAQQPVITGAAKDDAAIGGALDKATQGQGITLNAGQRTDYIGFLKKFNGLDYGTYAKGYTIDQLAPNQVRVTPAGAAVSNAAPGASTTPAGNVFTGDVTKAGAPLTARVGNQDRTVNPAQGVIVTRDGKDAKLSDIQQGDTVKVTTNPDGVTATRIDATSRSTGLGWVKWLPLLLLLPLLALLAWLLGAGARRPDSFILERNSGATATTTTHPVATERTVTTSRVVQPEGSETSQHVVMDADDTADRNQDRGSRPRR